MSIAIFLRLTLSIAKISIRNGIGPGNLFWNKKPHVPVCRGVASVATPVMDFTRWGSHGGPPLQTFFFDFHTLGWNSDHDVVGLDVARDHRAGTN
jgi:hypothetical protein